jgi:hypothetical protein
LVLTFSLLKIKLLLHAAAGIQVYALERIERRDFDWCIEQTYSLVKTDNH